MNTNAILWGIFLSGSFIMGAMLSIILPDILTPPNNTMVMCMVLSSMCLGVTNLYMVGHILKELKEVKNNG